MTGVRHTDLISKGRQTASLSSAEEAGERKTEREMRPKNKEDESTIRQPSILSNNCSDHHHDQLITNVGRRICLYTTNHVQPLTPWDTFLNYYQILTHPSLEQCHGGLDFIPLCLR